MATIVFYEKPGCANNARQKHLLIEAGHRLQVRNLLETHWGAAELRVFFGQRPVGEWFNRASPRIKAGEVVPETLDEPTALALMLADPLLIRRPLLQVDEVRAVGFDVAQVHAWIGLTPAQATPDPQQNLEQCQRTHHCPPPTSEQPV